MRGRSIAVPFLQQRCARTAGAILAPALVLALGLACGARSPGEPAVVRLLEFTQAGSREVRLNESLQFQFSAELDRASITGASFIVEDAAGRRARGTIKQRAKTLKFVPEFPLRKDLIDGGLLPGRTYTVRILGFPAPDGVRGLRGEPLAQSYVFQFKTAGVAGDEAVFVPPISAALPLVFDCRQRKLGPLDPIKLETVEAVDPRSLNDRAFGLVPASADAEDPPIPLRARLIENFADRAVVALQPISGAGRANLVQALDPGDYYLVELQDAVRFQTLGGLPIAPVWLAAGDVYVLLRVGEDALGSKREELNVVAPIPVDGVDGRAFLSDDGQVQIRFPAAAGSGVVGPIENLGDELADKLLMRDDESAIDLHATTIELPEDEELDLSSHVGVVVLRAQRRIDLHGSLTRRGAPDAPTVREWTRARITEEALAKQALSQYEAGLTRGEIAVDDPEVRAQIEDRIAAAERALTLTGFVEDALREGAPWTILIAGGDVHVTGEVDVDGELLIAAGGWVRASGRVSARTTWTTPEGGGDFGVVQDVPNALPLTLDAPLDNPLREPLRVAVVSQPVRPQGGVSDWVGLTTFADEGSGRARVRAIGERETGPRTTETFGPVDDLSLLKGCASVRLVIELVAEPGTGAWDPPQLEAVEVTWKRAAGAEEDGIRARGGASSGR